MIFRIFTLFFLLISTTYALKVEITKGQVEPTPIAVTDLVGEEEQGKKLGRDISGVIANDLANCGLFRLIDKSAFIQDAVSLQQAPRFADWRLVNAQLLFVGKVIAEGSKIRVDFRLFDVFSGSQMLGLSFTGDPMKWRKMAHMIADAVYKRVTGESGYFDTYIAFIDESGPAKGKRVHRLGIMDWDGYNPRYLTEGRHLVLTPRISPSNLEIAYLSYATGVPSVHLYNISTRTDRLLGRFEGMTFAPQFSPDGSSIIMSLEKEGASAIYCMHLGNRKLRQLTPHVSIDTSPCFSPDGQNIVFTSDRDSLSKGKHIEKMFIMDANGGNVRRVSFGEGKYSQPIWSPRGDWIAFTNLRPGGVFYLGVMRPDGSDERLIVESYLIEAPAWSANGRELLFTMKKGPHDRHHLYRVDLTGHNLQRVNTPHDASDGAWSKLLS